MMLKLAMNRNSEPSESPVLVGRVEHLVLGRVDHGTALGEAAQRGADLRGDRVGQRVAVLDAAAVRDRA